MQFLQEQTARFPERADDFFRLGELHEQKLWHQLSEALKELIATPFFQAESGVLVVFYDGFIRQCIEHFRPLDVVLIGTQVAARTASAQEQVDFLRNLRAGNEQVKGDPQASTLCLVETALARVRRGLKAGAEQSVLDVRAEAAKDELDEAEKAIRDFPGIMDSHVYSRFHLASLEYNKLLGSAAEFFASCMSYLAYTPLDTIPRQQQLKLASDVGVAALVGDVYHFGELLQHPIIAVLRENEQMQWLADLLNAFNVGDIAAYQTIAEVRGPSNPVLANNAAFLNQKIRITALMDLVFHRNPDDRLVTFSDISQHCKLPETEVELLLMKAFSIKVLRGKIDEVDQRVHFTWVQPRVLDAEQIVAMRARVEHWSAQVNEATIFMHNTAPDLLG